MKKLLWMAAALACVGSARAQSLPIDGGTLSWTNTVTSTLCGPSTYFNFGVLSSFIFTPGVGSPTSLSGSLNYYQAACVGTVGGSLVFNLPGGCVTTFSVTPLGVTSMTPCFSPGPGPYLSAKTQSSIL